MKANKIHIGVDINEANVKNRVGSNQYAFEILKALHSIDTRNSYTLYSSKSLVKDLPKERNNWRYKVIPPAIFWTQWRLPIEIFKQRKKLDVFFSPGHYAPRFSPIPTVITIMDLAFLKFPNFFKKKDTNKLTKWTKYSVKNADKIITISKNSKNDIKNYYHKNDSDLVIAYPGYSQSPKLPKDSKLNLPEKFILYVGTIQPRKNINRLIQAFEQLESNHHLVIAGKEGWLFEDTINFINSSEKRNLIHQLGFVSNQLLPGLILKADCLVLPGLYEGFGIPPLEAIHLGTIPVVSKTGSLPEVVGKSGITFDPYDVDSISNSIKNAIKLTPAEKKTHLEALKKHTSKFSWVTSAQKILEVLHEVAI